MSGYTQIEPTAMQGALGAEIRGLDVSASTEQATISELHRALLEHQLIYLHGQSMTPADLLAFSSQFGKIQPYAFATPLEGLTGITSVCREPGDKHNFGGVWHTDGPYQDHPPKITILLAIDIPQQGGDTMFADMYAAYAGLPADVKQRIDARRGIFSARKTHDRPQWTFGSIEHRSDQTNVKEQYLHPIVRTHPETGRKALYVSRCHMEGIDQLDAEESEPLLDFLCEHAVQTQYTSRLRWQVGTLVMYDNRCVQHSALDDYPGERRELYRVLIEGETPN